METWIKMSGSIDSGFTYVGNSPKEFTFDVPVGNNEKMPVTIAINVDCRSSISTLQKIEIDDDLIRIFDNIEDDDAYLLPKKNQELLSPIISLHRGAIFRVVNLIKYQLNMITWENTLVSDLECHYSVDGKYWSIFPYFLDYCGIPLSEEPFSELSAERIQAYLDNRFEPFLALKHLHHARRDGNPRAGWIEATMAAELAIKEFLSRKDENLATLLLELPSPPIAKMYGPILKKYGGVESPWKAALQKGSEKRNKLVHQPVQHAVQKEELDEYIFIVEAAIFHLLSILYPEDRLIGDLFVKMVKNQRPRWKHS